MEKSSVVRFAILGITLTAITSLYANQNALSFTIICMEDVIHSKSTNETEGDHWLNNSNKRNVLFSIIAIGQLLGNSSYRSSNTNNRIKVYLPNLRSLSDITTLANPLAVELGHLYLTIVRFLQGFALAIIIVSCGQVATQWSPHNESATFIAILSCNIQLGLAVTIPLATMLCQSLGWRSLYYFFGIFGILSTAAFFFMFRDDPRKHWMVSDKELKAITAGKEGPTVREPVPYTKICSDPCMHASLLLAIGGFAGLLVISVYGPTFINKALGIQLTNTGLLTALPHALAMVLKLLVGPLFDISTFISEKNRLIILVFLTQGITAFCLFVISQKPSEVLTQVAYCGASACIGLAGVSVLKIAQMVTQQHVDFVLVCITFCGCATAMILPAIVAIVCPNNTVDEHFSQ
ncbi:hypothetical protein KIN20_002907 [Parelaphostrongylus tenuis]|uniref:Major facilitator superfamily (MFS) profile domain-containing protein n=1 Tax=Parelaphostrongylus tenuis TaxID=148309 RepID=A0AAD5QDA4_PARTN|nr:hypothetical protein KIN20_002907 [Parelaphostrongylus tenuis]